MRFLKVKLLLLLLLLEMSTLASDEFKVLLPNPTLYPALTFAQDVCVAGDGTAYVIFGHRIKKLDTNGSLLLEWEVKGSDGKNANLSYCDVDSNHNVFISDSGRVGLDDVGHNIFKYDPNGTLLLQWGSKGSGDGEFLRPNGIAIDTQDNIYVLDSSNDRVQKFNNNGTYLGQWGDSSVLELAFDLAIDHDGKIFVLDAWDNKVKKFENNGTFIMEWGWQSGVDVYFGQPLGIAVDGTGNVYISNTLKNQIIVYDGNGGFLRKWGEEGDEEGQFNTPKGIDVHSDKVYVADYDNHRVQVFELSGNVVTSWGNFGNSEDKMNSPSGIAVNIDKNNIRSSRTRRDSSLYDATDYVTSVTTVYLEPDNHRAVFYTKYPSGESSENFVYEYYDHLALVGMTTPHSVTSYTSKEGSTGFFITDSANNCVLNFDEEGRVGGVYFRINNPKGIAVDRDSNIYVINGDTYKLEKHDSNGVVLKTWNVYDSSADFINPSDLKIDKDGHLIVTDKNSNVCKKYDTEGNYLGLINSDGKFIPVNTRDSRNTRRTEGIIGYVYGIAYDSRGNMYISDGGKHCVHKFDSHGNHLTQYGSAGSGEGEFYYPSDIAIDEDDNVFVADTGNNRIQYLEAPKRSTMYPAIINLLLD